MATEPRNTSTRRDFLATVAAGVLSAAAACSSRAATQNSTEESARLTARVTAPTKSIQPGQQALELAASRNGLLYVPRSYRPEQPATLVVLLHGAGGTAANWFGTYGNRAESLGIVMLAPESRGSTWDAVRGTFGPDVSFIDVALRYTFDHCAIDPKRVALAGFSDGASYALSLGSANGDLFTHLIAYSPGFARVPTIAGKPVIFVSHGTLDPVLPIAATSRVIVRDFRAQGYTVEYVEFVGAHEVPPPISTQALDWFLRT